MKVPFTNHTRHWESYGDRYLEKFDEVLKTGQYQGEHTTDAIEAVLGSFAARKAVMVQSGTEALTMALRAIKAPEGSEVIVPAYSFVATASAVVRAGLKPVFVDVDKHGLITDSSIIQGFSANTKVIMPVSMFGRSIYLEEYRYKDQFMIWDNAQGFLPSLHKGFLNCVSFDPMKVMPAFGSAGAIFCDDEMMEWLLKGMRRNDPFCPVTSQNSQVSSLISTGLLQSMLFYGEWNSQIKKIDEIYKKKIRKDVQDLWEGITSFHKFPIFHKKRDEMKAFLAANGIETKVHYPYILPELEMFGSQDPSQWPTAKRLSETELSLPIYPYMSIDEVHYVADKVNEFVDTYHQKTR